MSENSTEKMKSFLEDQRAKIEQVFNSSLEEAYKMKDSVNNYMGHQQRKLSTDFNGYVENMKESGRKVMDTWSYLPGGDMGARMENPDVVLSVPAMITRQGYTCETHLVESQGYLLNIHRIPRPKRGGAIPKKTILLQHGLFASSADWVMNGPERALGYVLAEEGYDVWMTNVRGNKYAKEHAWLKTDSKTYWNFSWHEVALHDVPAVIDYILKVKGNGTKISYLGHSMGTTILFAMLTLRPEYNKILTSGYALAPVAFLTELKSPLKNLAPVAANVAYMEMLYGSHEFLPKNSAIGKLTQSCELDSIDSYICKNVVFYICGYNEKQFNKTLLPVFMAHVGTGTSWKTPVHFAQEIVSGGKFQQFDYGSYGNQKMYGEDTPPEYDLSKITLPIRMFWAQNDLLSSEKDVKLLYEKLPSSAKIHMIEDPEFNHVDYLMAIDAEKLLNKKVKEWLNEDFRSTDFSFSLRLGK